MTEVLTVLANGPVLVFAVGSMLAMGLSLTVKQIVDPLPLSSSSPSPLPLAVPWRAATQACGRPAAWAPPGATSGGHGRRSRELY